jgi:threonine dehydratase
MNFVDVRVPPFAHTVLKPGSSTIGMGSGEAGATAPTTIFASVGMNGDCAGTGAVTISTGSP